MKRKVFPGLSMRLKLSVLFIIFTTFIGCNSNKTENKTIPQEDLSFAAPGTIDCFKLDSAKVNAFIKKASSGYEALILQFMLDDIVSPIGTFKLVAYFEENHAHHGTDADTTMVDNIPKSKCFVFRRAGKQIISNNYLSIEKLKKAISGNEKTYAYIKLTPISGTRGKTLNHILFKITAHDSNDTELKPTAKLNTGDDESNPSPPATPGFD